MDVLLDILGNDTRRRILQLLADEPRYFIQLSKDLGVSQQAVLKHLDLLEKHGFISSYSEESEFAAPKRKYFELNRSLMFSVGITKDAVEFFFHDIPQKEIGTQVERKELKNLMKELSALEGEENPISLLNEGDSLLKKINSQLKELAQAEIALLRMKQKMTKLIHGAIRKSFEDDLQRSILYATLGQKEYDVEELSALLDAREKEIGEALAVVKDRLAGTNRNTSSKAKIAE
jgi:predicted transcriptional regulator